MMFPRLGHGLGLRAAHHAAVLDGLKNAPLDGSLAQVDWFEIISDNHLQPGGRPRRVLHAVRERFPVVMHGVALSIGSADPLDQRYLNGLAALADELQPALISDHLCWSGVAGHHAHDLLPLPYTEEALKHVSERVLRVQDRLRRRILLENVSSYVAFTASVLPEWEFLAAVAERADCGILLDVNNVFVSAHNHGLDARAFVRALPSARIGQIHLAGHRSQGPLLLDTHDHPVRPEVWELYRFAIETHGAVSTLIEWDDALPSFDRVVDEVASARRITRAITSAGTRAHG